MHDFYICGHDGILNTYKRLKTMFYWSVMKSTIKQVMERYVVCKQVKVERVAYLGLFQPLLVQKKKLRQTSQWILLRACKLKKKKERILSW